MPKKVIPKTKAKKSPARKKISKPRKPTFTDAERAFLNDMEIPEKIWPSSRLSVDTLKSIYDDFVESKDMLIPVANSILDTLRRIPEVHSLKMRIKDPKHLASKIVRKVIERASFKPSVSNYNRLVTDLIGIRALHLFKDDWKPIHDFITGTWDLHERPIAYLRHGDSTDVFSGVDCRIREHERAYRSVHYTIVMTPTKNKSTAEIQVRTLFEEGWCEIDHQMRYPSGKSNSLLAQFLVIFNRLAGSADEMGSYIQVLQRTLQQQCDKYNRQLDTKENELRAMIKKLKIKDEERRNLQKKVDDLSKSSFTRQIDFSLSDHGPSFMSEKPKFLDSLILGPKKCSICGKPLPPESILPTCSSCLGGIVK